MFIVTWLFDKFGYMPKIDMRVGKVNIEAAWPFPVKPAKKQQAEVAKAPARKAKTPAKKTGKTKG